VTINPYQAPITAPHVPPPVGVDHAYVDQSGRVRVLGALLAIGALLAVVSAASTWLEMDLLARASRGQITMEEADANDQRQQLIAIATLLVTLVTTVVFGMVLVRANKNARALSGEPLEVSPGMMVGWFFVPFANLFKPYVAVREVWQRSKGAAPGLFGLWWAAWIVSGVLAQASWRMSDPKNTIPQLLTLDRVNIAGDIASLASCLLALWMVRSLHAGQQRHHQTGQPDFGG
jgi:hypothetical protein